jgi:hypothetical protein
MVMAYSLIFLITSLFLFLITTEIVTIRFIYENGRKNLIVDFMLFGIELDLSQKSDKKQKSDKEKGKERPFTLPASFKYLLSKSSLTLNSLSVKTERGEPANSVIIRAGVCSAISAMLALATTYSKNFTYSNIFIGLSDNNKTEVSFDINLQAHILALIGCGVIFISKKLRHLGEIKCRKAK